jgi:3'(2'), 5'-bisphosphate nucleotidase
LSPSSTRDLNDDHELAAQVAYDAGRLLLALRTTSDDPATLKREGDAQANVLILDALHRARPDDPILSEESADVSTRLESSRVWIVDPLDGTREYSEKGRDDWAVHIALVIDGVAAIGAVALPAQDLVLRTDPAPVVPPRGDRPIRLVVSRTRPPAVTDRIQAALGGELLPMGSAGAKTMAIVLGDADVYAHSGGQYQWDSAAPVAVARAAGLHTSRLDGSPLVYNEADPYLPDLLVCRPELADQVIAAAI